MFVPIEIDACPAYGWQGGPMTDVDIKTLRTKHERRNWVDGLMLHKFTLPFKNVRSRNYLRYLKNAYMALHGPHITFLCKDHLDFTHDVEVTDDPMPFGVGDGSESSFFLSKTYTFTDGVDTLDYVRPITKPVVSTVSIWMDTGSGWVDVTADVDIDRLTGEVSWGTAAFAPPDEAILGWKGEFRCCVRFTDFFVPVTIDSASSNGEEYLTNSNCTLQEVPGE